MNTLDRGYETLRQQVDAGQLQISREHVDGLLSCAATPTAPSSRSRP